MTPFCLLGADLEFATRNVVRQTRRSAFALAAIAFGMSALMLAAGFIDWNFLHYRDAMIESQYGHIRVHRAGYTGSGSSDPFAFLLAEQSQDLAAISALPGVRYVAPRLTLSGLVSRGDATVPFIAEGVDAGLEAGIGRSVTMNSGKPLGADDANGVTLGLGLAANLGVVPDDLLTLVVNSKTGSVNAVDARVRGSFSSISKEYDDVALHMPIGLARRLLKISGSHTWVIMLDDTAKTAMMVDALAQRLKPGEYEIVPWWKLSDFYNKSSALFSKQVGVIRIIIGLLIVLSISNTLMMGVVERTGEIGTSMALGSNRARILRRFLAEGLVLGVIGAILGALLGYALAAIVSAIGIPVPAPPGMSQGYVSRILVTPGLAFSAALLAIGTTLIAAVYPAWKASRMVIVDALRRARA